jgi:hypothetical protein
MKNGITPSLFRDTTKKREEGLGAWKNWKEALQNQWVSWRNREGGSQTLN